MSVKYPCDDCDETVPIVCTGKKQNPDRGTSEWWTIVSHKNKKTGQFCPGSGKLV